MTRIRSVAIATLVLVASAFAVAMKMQAFDLTGFVDPKGIFTLANHANATDSGIRVDRAGYACATVTATTAKTQNDASHLIDYLLLIDSIPGTAAWNPVDSIPVDTTDNKSYKLGYYGTRRWIRTVFRPSGAAADTFDTRATVILGCKRSR